MSQTGFTWRWRATATTTTYLQMHSSSISSPTPSSIGGLFHIYSNNNIKSLARAQIPPSTLIEFKVAVSRRYYCKNVVPRERNRFYLRNSANQDREVQISQEKEALGNGSGGPSTSLLSFLCPLLKLFSVSKYDLIDQNCMLIWEIWSIIEFMVWDYATDYTVSCVNYYIICC